MRRRRTTKTIYDSDGDEVLSFLEVRKSQERMKGKARIGNVFPVAGISETRTWIVRESSRERKKFYVLMVKQKKTRQSNGNGMIQENEEKDDDCKEMDEDCDLG